MRAIADDAGRPADAIEAALTDMVTVLTRAKVPYALIGGLATGYRSRPWYTKDVDLILDIPQITLPAVLAALGGLGFEFNERDVIAEFTRHHMAVLWRDGVRVDWLKALQGSRQHHKISTTEGKAGVPGTTSRAREERTCGSRAAHQLRTGYSSAFGRAIPSRQSQPIDFHRDRYMIS